MGMVDALTAKTYTVHGRQMMPSPHGTDEAGFTINRN